MKGTAINQNKSPGRVFNYLNGEWDDGVTRTIGGERIKLRELEEVCNMVLILTYRHGDQDSILWELNWGNWRGLKHTKICQMRDSTYKISCCLVLMHNGEELLTTPIARGLEGNKKRLMKIVATTSLPAVERCTLVPKTQTLQAGTLLKIQSF